MPTKCWPNHSRKLLLFIIHLTFIFYEREIFIIRFPITADKLIKLQRVYSRNLYYGLVRQFVGHLVGKGHSTAPKVVPLHDEIVRRQLLQVPDRGALLRYRLASSANQYELRRLNTVMRALAAAGDRSHLCTT